jgi:hypothetical protein
VTTAVAMAVAVLVEQEEGRPSNRLAPPTKWTAATWQT